MASLRLNPPTNLTEDSYIKQISEAQRRQLCMLLDADDKWKEIIGHIPNSQNTGDRYSDTSVSYFEREIRRPNGSPSRELLRDWQTALPTIRDLLECLFKAELHDIYHFVLSKILCIASEPNIHHGFQSHAAAAPPSHIRNYHFTL